MRRAHPAAVPRPRPLAAALAVVALAFALLAALPPAPAASAPPSHRLDPTEEATLHEYAAATWRSFEAMVHPDSGLPSDRLRLDGSTDVETSTSNIGVYLWSTVAARDLGIIDAGEAVDRITAVLDTLGEMERHEPSGQFFNWYDHRTGEKLEIWPASGEPLTPILSSVDNGWLATGLRVVAGAVPGLAERAQDLYDSMDFGFYYREDRNQILFHYVPSTGQEVCCYDTLVSESRIATYLGIINGQIPPKAYFGSARTFAPTCAGSFQEREPEGVTRTYRGVEVYEGHYDYRGLELVPSWGGSMFEALMPALVVPEEEWGTRSWRVNHPATVAAQIEHGLDEAEYGYWGWSPADVPLLDGSLGYWALGVDGAGMDPNGYPSNLDRTLVDEEWEGCETTHVDAQPPPSAYTNGVVTAHASFLALPFAPGPALDNLAALRGDFPGYYTEWGFQDTINVDSGEATGTFLSLDQGMIMAGIANTLLDDRIRDYFVGVDAWRNLRPVLGEEQFTAGPRCLVAGLDRRDVERLVTSDAPPCGRAGR